MSSKIVPDESTPCAPAKQQMNDYAGNDAPPPPYDPDAPQSRAFWRNYSKGQDAHCFADGFCRVMCCPCMTLGAILGTPWCVFRSMTHDDDDKPSSECNGCIDDPFYCCCIYDRLDRCLPKWSGACVGCIKFPEERSDMERTKMRWVGESIRSCVCCCCDACTWLCATACCTCIRDCVCNLGENCRRCGHGACVCGELVLRRACCCPAKQEMY